ncbi:hypothetical protein [Bacillus sp. CECT 9360]|uniref:hypothetical protein n=1 Tax=Bacillus sp. CECT 9360 TaxID=2845821 RepID=UPI001E42DCD8|nr:hypothetical protein [Bacillus sp. CECT 9360]CAH0344515.1 hypothetical protein BCI9360_00771 [Bacillus sp. CECT 9360]
MNNNEFDMEESQRRLMELMVSRTLKKHGISKGKFNLSEEERDKLRSTIELLQKQSAALMGNRNTITEADVNPGTNMYNVRDTESDESLEQEAFSELNLAQRRKNRRLE